jgi:D-glycero-D-manno-heptose 1,7-bisphosphate phosphatase
VRRTNEALVAKLAREGVTVAAVEVCMHHPEGGEGGDPALVGPCACRKPKPGLIERLVTRFAADRASSWMIGDARSDIEAGRTALVFATARCELCPLKGGPAALVPDVHGATLVEVAAAIVRHS